MVPIDYSDGSKYPSNVAESRALPYMAGALLSHSATSPTHSIGYCKLIVQLVAFLDNLDFRFGVIEQVLLSILSKELES